MTSYFVIVNPTSGRDAGATIIPALQALLDAEALAYKLVQTDRPLHATEPARQAAAQGISIMNGRRMGGGFHMAPHSYMDDSLFDICIAARVSRPRIFNPGHQSHQFYRSAFDVHSPFAASLPRVV